MEKNTSEFIHTMWDELADFDAARADEALTYLMTSLCRIADAQNAIWIGAVRVDGYLAEDPARGWRPRAMRFLHASQALDGSAKKQVKDLDEGSIDETTVRNIALAGRFRVNRLVDLVPESWFDSAYYKTYYRDAGHVDAIWAGAPINEDAECYFGVFRDGNHPRFTPEERDLVAYALRGLKWFYRRQMLSHGLMVAASPLTATEREVIGSLLTGLSEKQIAAARNQSPHTTHEYISSIYRKFGVGNRAALMALWLGR